MILWSGVDATTHTCGVTMKNPDLLRVIATDPELCGSPLILALDLQRSLKLQTWPKTPVRDPRTAGRRGLAALELVASWLHVSRLEGGVGQEFPQRGQPLFAVPVKHENKPHDTSRVPLPLQLRCVRNSPEIMNGCKTTERAES